MAPPDIPTDKVLGTQGYTSTAATLAAKAKPVRIEKAKQPGPGPEPPGGGRAAFVTFSSLEGAKSRIQRTRARAEPHSGGAPARRWETGRRGGGAGI